MPGSRHGQPRIHIGGSRRESTGVSSGLILKKMPNGAIGCVVPMHRDLAVGTLRGILRQAEVSAEDFLANL